MVDATVAVTDQSFGDVVLNAAKPVLVDFWAEWCGPCKAIGPVLESLAGEMGDKITIAKMDVDSNPAIPTQFSIRSIPTMIMFKDGEAVDTMVGAQPKAAIQTMIDKHL
jgi:thioredoxin 1